MNLDESYSSDDSDEDFNPALEQGKVSEEEVSGSGSDASDDELEIKAKRKGQPRQNKKKRRKRGNAEELTEPVIVEGESQPVTAEAEKARADDLWSSFMSDVGGPAKKKTPVRTSAVGSDKKDAVPSKVPETKKTVTVTEIFSFAGEEVKITKEVAKEESGPSPSPASGFANAGPKPKAGGLAAIASLLGKPQKISTLEKTKLDWDSFKKEENIEEDLKTFNQGRHGYLERQAFLERTDLRQFEKERDARQSRRPPK